MNRFSPQRSHPDRLAQALASPSPALDRRRFLQLAGLFGVSALTATSCRRLPIGRPDDPSLRVGYLPITDAAPLLAAIDKGFFRAEGLDVATPQKYKSWDAIVRAFMARQVNVIHLLMPTTMWVRYGAKFPGKVVAWNHTNGSALTVLPEVDRLEDLSGRTIAVPSWLSIHNIVLQMLLARADLEPVLHAGDATIGDRQVGLKVMPPPDMLAALRDRTIAGYIVAEPFNAAAESQKVGKLLRLTGDVWQDHACCVVFMHEDDLARRPDWTQAVVNAIVRSQQWSNNNRRELAYLLSKDGSQYTPFSVDVLGRVLTTHDTDFYHQRGVLRHPEWRASRIDFQPYPFASYTRQLTGELQQTLVGSLDLGGAAGAAGDRQGAEGSPTGLDPLHFLREITPDRAAADLVDESFVRRALKLVGGPQAFNLSAGLERLERVEI